MTLEYCQALTKSGDVQLTCPDCRGPLEVSTINRVYLKWYCPICHYLKLIEM